MIQKNLSRLMIGVIGLIVLAACSGGASDVDPPPVDPIEDSSDDEGEVVGEEEEAAQQDETDVAEATGSETTASGCPSELEPSFMAGVNPNVLSGDGRTRGMLNLTGGWTTDWDRHTIPYDEILSGGVTRDGIPPIDDPQFISIAEADFLFDREPVIALEIGGEARAYPLQIITWHEVINDELCGIPVAVTFCPLCNSALVFDRRVNGEVYRFGVSGFLRNSDLMMWDRQTESLWQQFTGEGVIGEHAGDQLGFIPSSLVSYADFKATYPDGQVLSQDTGFTRNYGTNPYAGYDSLSSNPFLFRGEIDDRLVAMVRVVGVNIDGVQIAYPYPELAKVGVVEDTVNGQDIVIFYELGTTSALGASSIANAEDVGAAAVYEPYLDGEKVAFWLDGDQFFDDRGNVWNILGQAISGPDKGATLTPLTHSDHFWFSWAAFFPDTTIFEVE